MEQIILVVHVLIAIAIIGLVLLQQGKGAEAGASFGAGASQTVFGSAGGGNFFTRATAVLATLFFVTSFGLAVFAKQQAEVALTDGVPMVEDAAELPAMIESSSDIPESDVPALSETGTAESDIPAVTEGDKTLDATDIPE